MASICPLCRGNNRQGELRLRQINAQEAVYVCTNSHCPYPVGFNSATVHRPVREMTQQVPKIKEHVEINAVSNEQNTLNVDTELDQLLCDFIDQQS